MGQSRSQHAQGLLRFSRHSKSGVDPGNEVVSQWIKIAHPISRRGVGEWVDTRGRLANEKFTKDMQLSEEAEV